MDLLVGATVAVLVVVGGWWAQRRGWIRLSGSGKGSAALAFAAVEDLFAPSRTKPREIQEAQRRIGAPLAPVPGDGDDPARPFAGRIVLPRPQHGDEHGDEHAR